MHFPKNIYPVNALFLYHLKVGIRLSLRVMVPVVASIFGFYYILRPEFFLFLASELFGRPGTEGAGMFTFIICLFVAFRISPRILSGLKGWIRHLPISGLAHRRITALSIFISLIPILSIFIVLMTVLSISQIKVEAAYFAGLIFLGLAVSHAVLPVRKKTLNLILSSSAGMLVAFGSWNYFFTGVSLLILTDILAGPIYFKKDKKTLKPLSESFILPLISWRALGFRLILPYLYSIGILGLSSLFLANNTFSFILSQRILRGAGTLSLVIFFVFLSGRLGFCRPLWPWARSFPWSARQRILWDTFFLGLHAIPIFILIGFMNPPVTLVLLGCYPLLSVLAAWSVTPTMKTRFGAAGKMLPFGGILTLCMVLTSWTSLFCLPTFFIILNMAANEDKNLKVSSWLELYHLAKGDSQSWSSE